jgi:hypothetical protein
MQALGFYGFASVVKGNKTFLNYIPAGLASLRLLVEATPGLEKLRTALGRLR